ncbi:MAG: DNA primase [Phycisphaerales bacterium JB037]
MTTGFQTSDDRDRVRDASDIVRVIGEQLQLRPKGREFVCLCPFHDDHNPSMCVVPAKQIFHCFVCGAGGDVFSFVQRFHHMDFPEALRFLADRAGIELTPFKPRAGEGPAAGGTGAGPAGGRLSRQALLEANRKAAEFFVRVLNDPDAGAAARAVIERRGISAAMVERFGLGAAPDGWDGLTSRLARNNIDARPFAEVGLLKTRDQGGQYDALRHRLIFPIHDQVGRVIAFGGRKIRDEDEPKYLNSPETRLFDKSSTLYGLHQASRAIQRTGTAIVTEGYTDVIACHQAGFENVVATLGTALTGGHAGILRRLCDSVVLLFDSDEAGGRAADRATEVFFSESLDVRVATFDAIGTGVDAKDPDELLKREDGVERFRALIAGAEDLLEYRYRRLAARVRGQGPAALEKALDEELRTIASLGFGRASPVRRELILRRLSQITGLSGAVISGALRRASGAVRRRAEPEGGAGAERSPRGRSRRAGPLPPEEVLLGCALTDGSLLLASGATERNFLMPSAYADPLLAEVAQIVMKLVHDGRNASLPAVLALVEDPAAQESAVDLQRRIEQDTDSEPERLAALWRDCVSACARRASDAPPADLVARLEAARRTHATHGPNHRALPRPGA